MIFTFGWSAQIFCLVDEINVSSKQKVYRSGKTDKSIVLLLPKVTSPVGRHFDEIYHDENK